MIDEVYAELLKRVDIQLEIITPEWAESALKANNTEDCPNRRIDSSALAEMKRDLLDGRWNHDSWDCLAFDEDGHLVNGQHRLRMVSETKQPIVAWVQYGVREKSKEVLDTGKGRSLGDILRMRGVHNYTKVALITATVGAHQRRRLYSNSPRLTTSYLLEVLEANPLIHESAAWYSTRTNDLRTVGEAGRIASVRCLTLMKHQGASTAVDFWERVATGAGCSATDPALALRSKLISIQLDKSTRVERHVVCGFIVHAWNLNYQGRECKRLVLPGTLPEIL